MNSTSTFALLLIMAGFAGSGGPAFAESDDDDSSGGRYETERDAVTSRVAQSGVAAAHTANLAHWQVTGAVYDHTGRLSLLQHTVPLHDMAVFGRVTSGIVENGLTLDRVDAVYNEADAATPEAHYHFTQRFL